MSQETRRLVPFKDLKGEFGIGFTLRHIRRLEKAGSFPRRVKIGSGVNARVYHYRDEIEAHIASHQVGGVPPDASQETGNHAREREVEGG